MIQIELSDTEMRILAEILETAYSDLRMEIANTDSKDFRDMLKERKAVIAKALDAMGRPVVTAEPDVL
ncbi:MAG TPA: hypothetical protein VLC48_00080 [Gemmatimonadota bacterium]|nr:hypothetical protein [Gemmatimonadota bacterium]